MGARNAAVAYVLLWQEENVHSCSGGAAVVQLWGYLLGMAVEARCAHTP
jgi:hypothetical protein